MPTCWQLSKEINAIWTIFADTGEPTLISSIPSDGSAAVAAQSNITLGFSEPVYAQIGNITIRNVRVHKQGDNPSPFIRLSSKVDGLRIENFKREPGGNPKTPTMLIANKIEVETDSQTVLGQGSITELKLDTK